jgi:hypothetical protein
MKTQSYKLIDITEGYNFINVSSFDTIQKQYYFSNATNLVRDYYSAKILYYFFMHISDLKHKN